MSLFRNIRIELLVLLIISLNVFISFNLDLGLYNYFKDFKLILTETQNSLIKQYQGLLGTEKVDLKFEEDGIDTIASLSTEINQNVENIGARRLHTVMEKLLEEVSYTASDIGPTEIIINKEYVENSLGELIKSQDLSKFIL